MKICTCWKHVIEYTAINDPVYRAVLPFTMKTNGYNIKLAIGMCLLVIIIILLSDPILLCDIFKLERHIFFLKIIRNIFVIKK